MSGWGAKAVALVPVAALTVAIPFVNRLDPSIFGLPFVFLWVIVWVLLTPGFLWITGRLEHRW